MLPLFEQSVPTHTGLEAGRSFIGELDAFAFNGKATARHSTEALLNDGSRVEVPTFVNEFWLASFSRPA